MAASPSTDAQTSSLVFHGSCSPSDARRGESSLIGTAPTLDTRSADCLGATPAMTLAGTFRSRLRHDHGSTDRHSRLDRGQRPIGEHASSRASSGPLDGGLAQHRRQGAGVRSSLRRPASIDGCRDRLWRRNHHLRRRGSVERRLTVRIARSSVIAHASSRSHRSLRNPTGTA